MCHIPLFIAIFLFSVLNRFRGGGIVDIKHLRVLSTLTMGLIAGIASWDIYTGIVVSLGMWIWALLGWGLYFASCTGRWRKDEREIPPLDWLGLKLFPFVTEEQHASNYARGVFCMGFRALVMSIPLFTGLYYLGYCHAFYYWPLFALQGVVYWLFRGIYNRGGNPIHEAEYAFGAVAGLAVMASILMC